MRILKNQIRSRRFRNIVRNTFYRRHFNTLNVKYKDKESVWYMDPSELDFSPSNRVVFMDVYLGGHIEKIAKVEKKKDSDEPYTKTAVTLRHKWLEQWKLGNHLGYPRLWGEDITIGGWKRGYVGSADAIFKKRVVEKGPGAIYYALGYDTEPMVVYFDLDDGGSKKTTFYSREKFLSLIMKLKTIISTIIKKKYVSATGDVLNLELDDFVLHDSYKETTNSAHLYVPSVAAVNQVALISFIKSILEYDDTRELHNIIDLKAYSQGRMMRALYCCKKGHAFPMLEGGFPVAPVPSMSFTNFCAPLYHPNNVSLLLQEQQGNKLN